MVIFNSYVKLPEGKHLWRTSKRTGLFTLGEVVQSWPLPGAQTINGFNWSQDADLGELVTLYAQRHWDGTMGLPGPANFFVGHLLKEANSKRKDHQTSGLNHSYYLAYNWLGFLGHTSGYLIHCIGLLGKILTGNPWVFTIKLIGLSCKFSHNLILWLIADF